LRRRDEKNIIIIDTNPDNYALQPHNAIHISEWNGDLDDTQLLDLVLPRDIKPATPN